MKTYFNFGNIQKILEVCNPFATKNVAKNLLLTATAIIFMAGFCACDSGEPDPPKKEVHPIVGKWEMVAVSEGHIYAPNCKKENLEWIAPEAEFFQVFYPDGTTENVMFWTHNLFLAHEKMDGYKKYRIAANDSIIYEHIYEPKRFPYVQEYDISEDGKTLTLYFRSGYTTLAGPLYVNFKYRRVGGTNE